MSSWGKKQPWINLLVIDSCQVKNIGTLEVLIIWIVTVCMIYHPYLNEERQYKTNDTKQSNEGYV